MESIDFLQGDAPFEQFELEFGHGAEREGFVPGDEDFAFDPFASGFSTFSPAPASALSLAHCKPDMPPPPQAVTDLGGLALLDADEAPDDDESRYSLLFEQFLGSEQLCDTDGLPLSPFEPAAAAAASPLTVTTALPPFSSSPFSSVPASPAHFSRPASPSPSPSPSPFSPAGSSSSRKRSQSPAELPSLPPRKRKAGVVMPQDEKKERNKVSAQKYRLKLRAEAHESEARCLALLEENRDLTNAIDLERKKIEEFREILRGCGVLG